MAVYDGGIQWPEIEVMFWMDPKRYRAMVWGRNRDGIYCVKIKMLVDKDKDRLRMRTEAFVRSYLAKIRSS